MDKIESFKTMMKPGDGMDAKKSLNKLWIGLIASILISAITYGMQELQAANIDPKYAFITGLGVTIMYGLQNAAKHWRDKETQSE